MKDSFLSQAAVFTTVRTAFSLWNSETEDFLRNVVTLGAVRDWAKVAALMRTQFPTYEWTDTDCKGRWEEILNAPDSKKPWVEQEELDMLVAHKLCNNKWSSVAGLLNGRSNNSIKNRFYSIFRKVKNKIKRLETGFNSRIELLEILYMMSLMEIHLMQPFPPVIQKGKRGKDYVYNLLQTIRMDEVSKFKVELTKQTGKEQRLGDVWEELAVPLEKTKFQLPENIKKLITQDNSFVHEVNPNLPPLPQIEPMVLSHPKCGLVLPKYNETTKPGLLTEEEKSFMHAQVFLSKIQIPNQAAVECMTSGTRLNYLTLHTPGPTPMPTPMLTCPTTKKSEAENQVSHSFKCGGFGDFLSTTQSNFMHQAQQMIPLTAQTQSTPMSIINSVPMITSEMETPVQASPKFGTQVTQPQYTLCPPPGYILRPAYKIQPIMMLSPEPGYSTITRPNLLPN